MSAQQLAAFGLAFVPFLLWMGIRGLRPPVQPPPPPPPVAPVFRRPAEFGPLYLPQDRVDRIRAKILAYQLAEPDDTLAYVDVGAARVGLRTPLEREESVDRTLYWLSHWDDAVLALTGRGLA